jgi:hypothetical protein
MEIKLSEHGCSDRDCIMQPKTGMVTNGGCTCATQLQRDGYQNVLKVLWKLRQEIRELKRNATGDKDAK